MPTDGQRLPYAVALASIFAIYVGMSWKSDIPPYYFVLHPIGAALFVYIMLRSMTLTLARGGVVWRGTFYPLGGVEKRHGLGVGGLISSRALEHAH